MTMLSLTREEAAARTALLTVDRYDIEVDMTGLLEGARWRSVSTVTFGCRTPGAETFVDCAGDVVRASLNGRDLDVSRVSGGRLPLADLASENVLVLEQTCDNTASGEGILRTVDPTDGGVYVWTSLEPDEARRLWACFDQPDLKAPHRFTVHAPEAWKVASNGAPESIGEPHDRAGVSARTWSYPDTPPLSTYVVVVNAGPFHEVRRQVDGYDLGFYCRQSLVPHLERDLEELVTLTRQGLAFFGEQFGIAFPQERYDQVFVPNLGGAMENWGCVTYGDSQLFRTPPSHQQRAVRAEFVLHEMAHMWFGDLVTMQWWDDLWLNEAFASWAANWGLAEATEFSDQWATHLAQSKKLAYDMDLGPASHPIRADVPDVTRAMANFDVITYEKGMSVLHQLMAWVGRDAYIAGLQDYFARHAWGNTVLDDLMGAFGRAAGQDLGAWTAAWLDRSGPDQMRLLARDGVHVVELSSPDEAKPRPHRVDIASFDTSSGRPVPTGRTEVRLTEEATPVDLPSGDLHLLNAGDHTYAVVRVDPAELAAMVEALPHLTDPLDRALVVMTAHQQLLLGAAAPRDVVRALAQGLRAETNPALVEPMLSLATLVADRWAAPAEQPALVRELADAAAVVAASGQNLQPALRVLASTASTPEHWAVVDAAVAGESDLDLAWRAAIRRAETEGVDRAALEALLAADPDPDAATTRRLKVLAASREEWAKEEVWRAFFVDRSIPASRDTLELGATFWRVPQSDLLQPFALRYLEELTRLTGGLLNQGVVIRAMFPQGVGDEAFLARAREVAESGTVSAYAANQLRAGAHTLSRIHAARAL